MSWQQVYQAIRKLLVVTVIGLAGGALPALAQTPALSGRVSSQEEGNMEGVLVRAKKTGSTIAVSVVSDAQGRYSFPADRLDAGQYAVFIQQIDERCAVGRFLPQCFVVQNDAAAPVADALGGEQHVAIGAAVFFDVLYVDAVEAAAYGAGAFVRREDAAPWCNHGFGDSVQIIRCHKNFQ